MTASLSAHPAVSSSGGSCGQASARAIASCNACVPCLSLKHLFWKCHSMPLPAIPVPHSSSNPVWWQ